MKRSWNASLWVGFFLVQAGVLSYIPFFSLFPITRDFPWVNLLLFCAGGVLLTRGLFRAFGKPELYRGKIFGPMLALLSVLAITVFSWGIFYVARQLPVSAAAPRAGQKAPDFTLPDQNGKPITLAGLLASSSPLKPGAKSKGVLLIFYRGYW